jgi:hypothetical protein
MKKNIVVNTNGTSSETKHLGYNWLKAVYSLTLGGGLE